MLIQQHQGITAEDYGGGLHEDVKRISQDFKGCSNISENLRDSYDGFQKILLRC